MLKAPLKDLYYNGAFTYSIKGGKDPRLGDEDRRLMHLVPAPAVRLMKRRVLSRPGVNRVSRCDDSTNSRVNRCDDSTNSRVNRCVRLDSICCL